MNKFGFVATTLVILLAGCGSESDRAAPQSKMTTCDELGAETMGALVCTDPVLSELDKALAAVLAQAADRAVDNATPRLDAAHKRWREKRERCAKSKQPTPCLERMYRTRIAVLQAQYRLVPAVGPVAFICEGVVNTALAVTFFETTLPTLIVESGDRLSLMVLKRSASGARYEGKGTSFWEHQGEATVRWGDESEGVVCRKGKRLE